MQEQARTVLEVIAPTVDEAVARGLSELGLSLDDVEVEILDRGGRPLFGLLGRRQARVRLTVKTPPRTQAEPPSPPEPEVQAPAEAEKAEEKPVAQAPNEEQGKRRRSRGRRGGRRSRRTSRGSERAGDKPAEASARAEDEERALNIARETVAELLEKMGVEAEVTARYGEADRGSRRPIMVDITGKDLSILIGRRASRLNALQFITRLIVGKELGRTVTIIVDVENYRTRREQQLRRMAKRLADQAARTGRRIALEPMPANERRIIHIALRDDPRVTTQSVGTEPKRKVTIIPVTRKS